jgi:hypothetical protein
VGVMAKRKLLPFQELKSGRPARRLVVIPTELSRALQSVVKCVLKVSFF